MNKKINIIIIIALVCLSAIAIAGKQLFFHSGNRIQTPEPDIKNEYSRLVERFMKNDSMINIAGTIRLYDGKAPEVVKEQTAFLFSKDGQQFYSELEGQQTICNGKIIAQLDTLNKQIWVSPADDINDMFSRLKNPAMPLGQLFSDTATFKIKGTISGDNTERKMVLQSDLNPDIRSYTIVYDPSTYVIRQAEIQWWKSALARDTVSLSPVWITKIKYQYADTALANADTMMNKLIIVKHDQFMPAPAYSKYAIHVNDLKGK